MPDAEHNDLDALNTPYPALTANLPGIGGVHKQSPESFVVEEIPAYLPCGEGEHLYLWVEKRDVPHNALADAIKKRFSQDAGTAGMKDRRAVTRQWVSVHTPETVTPGELAPGIEVLAVSRHRNKLKTNHLRGNRFVIELTELAVAPDVALERATAILAELAAHGTPNYFGSQRFGRNGSTLRNGLRLLAGKSGRPNARMDRLAASAVQSIVFNDVLRRRIEDSTVRTALLGDRLNRTTERGQQFVTADVLAAAQAGIDRGELIPTGPIWGPSMYEVADDVLAIETASLAKYGLTPQHFERRKKLTSGTRRDLLVSFLDDPTCEPTPTGLRIGFSLPSGAYATVVLHELTKLDFSAWEAP